VISEERGSRVDISGTGSPIEIVSLLEVKETCGPFVAQVRRMTSGKKNVDVICVFFCVFVCFSVLEFAIAQARWATRLDGATHAGEILTEALEKEKPTGEKMTVFLGILPPGQNLSRPWPGGGPRHRREEY